MSRISTNRSQIRPSCHRANAIKSLGAPIRVLGEPIGWSCGTPNPRLEDPTDTLVLDPPLIRRVENHLIKFVATAVVIRSMGAC